MGKKLAASVVAPAGDRLSLQTEPGGDMFHLASFTPDRESFWAVTVENDAGPVAVTVD